MAQTPDDLLNELDALADSGSKPSASSKSHKVPGKSSQNEDALLADLASLAERPKTASRPGTPRTGAKRSIERSRTPGSGYGLPAGTAKRDSIEQRRPKDRPSPTPTAEVEVKQEAAPADEAGGWGWGSIWSTATAAVKTAEAVVKEVQQSEEGKKWVDQVKGNADVLRGLGIYPSSLSCSATR